MGSQSHRDLDGDLAPTSNYYRRRSAQEKMIKKQDEKLLSERGLMGKADQSKGGCCDWGINTTCHTF